MSQLPTHEETQAILHPLGFSPAEVHGMACGFICGKISNRGLSQWQHHLLNVDEDLASLDQLFEASQKQFAANNFTLQLLLPDDDSSLAKRTQALTDWCKGFLSGLGEAQLHSKLYDDEALQEVLRDLEQISQAQYENIEASAENEQDFFEVEEHVRLSALFVYTELRLLAQKEELASIE